MSMREQIPMKPAAAPARIERPTPFGSLQRKCACGGSASSGGDCAECKKKKMSLQRRAATDAKPATATPPGNEVPGSPGQSPAAEVTALFQSRAGHDFSRVPVHGDPKAEESAKEGNAIAHPFGTLRAIQAKLEINRPGDFYEQEADRAADQVMRMVKAPDDEGEKDHARGWPASAGVVQGTGSPLGAGVGAPPIVDEALRSPGQPLPPSTQEFFGPRFGHDFSVVRVHNDHQAGKSAQAVAARAYTVGKDLVFAPGQYAPGTASGQRLIAHELTHVVQQGAARPVSRLGDSGPARSALPPSVQREPLPGAGAAGPNANIALTFGANPHVVRQPRGSMIQVTFDKQITATGTAQVSGPDASKYEFGFLQICRPFDVMRATYHESGAPAGPGKDLNRDGTNAIRKVQPALDGGDQPWFDGKSANGPNAKVDFSDLPDSPFERSVGKNGTQYDITGVAANSFFFTAFAVKGPDGVFRPLRTFFWSFGHCEDLTGANLSQRKVGAPVNRSSVATCPACNASEPGFSKINDPRGPDTCLALVSNAWGNVSFDGPGTFSINC